MYDFKLYWTLTLASAVTGCVSISAVCISIDITSYSAGLKTCAIIAGIKKYRSIIKKKK